jgi:hypothetical protein
MNATIEKHQQINGLRKEASSVHVRTSENMDGTNAKSDTPLTQAGSGSVLDQTRRNLIALRVKHGAETPVGRRCSNLIELIQCPEIPHHQVTRQMDDLQRLLSTEVRT